MGSLAAVQPRKHTRVRANKRRCRSTVSKIFPFASAEPVRDQAVLTMVGRLAVGVYFLRLQISAWRVVPAPGLTRCTDERYSFEVVFGSAQQRKSVRIQDAC